MKVFLIAILLSLFTGMCFAEDVADPNKDPNDVAEPNSIIEPNDVPKTVFAQIKCEDVDIDDTLTLEISEPNITKDANSIVYVWSVKCCDNHGACDDAWLRTDNSVKGDINNDKKVDFKDLAIVANHWLKEID